MLRSPLGGSTEGQRGALERSLDRQAGALTWRRTRHTSVKSRLKSARREVPAGEFREEKHDTAMVWCKQEDGRPPEMGGSEGGRQQGGPRQQMVGRKTSLALAAVAWGCRGNKACMLPRVTCLGRVGVSQEK